MTREEAIWWVNHLFEIRKEEYFNKRMMKGAIEVEEAQTMVLEALSAETIPGYTEWLEKIIIDNEGANEWLCEDTPDLEWCENNCHYSSIQAECLRHLYEVSKGGDNK